MSAIGNAIFDTEIDKFVTGVWPDKQLDKILRIWKRNHPDLNMSRFEIRPRKYAERPEERQAILIIERATNQTVCYYHWDNRGYAQGYEPEKYFFVKYMPSNELDITDIMERNGFAPWDGKGEVITDW